MQDDLLQGVRDRSATGAMIEEINLAISPVEEVQKYSVVEF
jgi:hypothetical protein